MFEHKTLKQLTASSWAKCWVPEYPELHYFGSQRERHSKATVANHIGPSPRSESSEPWGTSWKCAEDGFGWCLGPVDPGALGWSCSSRIWRILMAGEQKDTQSKSHIRWDSLIWFPDLDLESYFLRWKCDDTHGLAHLVPQCSIHLIFHHAISRLPLNDMVRHVKLPSPSDA